MELSEKKWRTYLFKLEPWAFGWFLFFVFTTSFGEIFAIEEWRLFGEFSLPPLSVGNSTGNFLVLFSPLLVLALYQKKESKKTWQWYEIVAFLFLGYLLLNLFLAYYPRKARKAPKVFFYSILCYYTVVYLVRSQRRFWVVLLTFGSGCILIALGNLYHFFVLKSPWIRWHWSWKSFLASYLALNICVCAFLLPKISSKSGRYFALVVLALAWLALLATAARSTYLALPLGLLVVSVLYQRQLVIWVLAGLGLSALLLVFLYGGTPLQRAKSFLELPVKLLAPPPSPGGEEQSSSSRPKDEREEAKRFGSRFLEGRIRYIWPVAWEMFSERPILGIGTNSFTVHLKKRYSHRFQVKPWHTDAHCTPLQIALGLGVIGVFFYLLFLYGGWKLLRENIQILRSHPPLQAFNMAILAWFICHFFEGLVAVYYYKQRHVMALALALALALQTRNLILPVDSAVDSEQGG